MGFWPFGKNKKNAADAAEKLTEDAKDAEQSSNPSSEFTVTDLQEGASSKKAEKPSNPSSEFTVTDLQEGASSKESEEESSEEDESENEPEPMLVSAAADKAEDADRVQPQTQAYAGPVTIEHDAIGGDTGPFDGDSVDINDFDFSDFAEGILNLGSIQLPLPKGSQVQVELGEQGPRMLHVVTEFGRVTPVAFAAPNSGGMWEESSDEIIEGMQGEGMPATFEEGPWGREVVGRGDNGVIRIVGVEGPRWLYRVTLAAPHGKEDQLAELAHEIIARSFIYRGSSPVLAGNSLPVELPAQLAAQLQQAMAQQQQQQQNQN